MGEEKKLVPVIYLIEEANLSDKVEQMQIYCDSCSEGLE